MEKERALEGSQRFGVRATVLHYNLPAPAFPRKFQVLVPNKCDSSFAIEKVIAVRNFSLGKPSILSLCMENQKPKACLETLPTELLQMILGFLPSEDAVSLGISSDALFNVIPERVYGEIAVLHDNDVPIHGVYVSELAMLWTEKRQGITWFDVYSCVRNYCWVERQGACFVVHLHSVQISERPRLAIRTLI